MLINDSGWIAIFFVDIRTPIILTKYGPSDPAFDTEIRYEITKYEKIDGSIFEKNICNSMTIKLGKTTSDVHVFWKIISRKTKQLTTTRELWTTKKRERIDEDAHSKSKNTCFGSSWLSNEGIPSTLQHALYLEHASPRCVHKMSQHVHDFFRWYLPATIPDNTCQTHNTTTILGHVDSIRALYRGKIRQTNWCICWWLLDHVYRNMFEQ